MKQRIRITESDLHRIVKESVNRVLKEGFGNSAKIYNDLSRLLDEASDLSGELIGSAYNDGNKGLMNIATTIQNALWHLRERLENRDYDENSQYPKGNDFGGITGGFDADGF